MTHPARCWATRTQAAEHVRVSPETIDNWVDQGLIHSYRLGARVIRYDLNEIDAALTPTIPAEQETAGGQPQEVQ